MQGITSQDAPGSNTPSDFSDAIFARRLRALREASGLTQQQVADVMAATGNRIHRSTIGKIESGDRPVTVGEAVELAGILGVPLAELVTEPGRGLITVQQHQQQKAHRARVEAQVQLRARQYEAAERRKFLDEQQLLYAAAVENVREAERRVAELGREDYQ